jgi:hypothetical protein
MWRTLDAKGWSSTPKAKAPLTGLLSDIGFLWVVASPETKGLGMNGLCNAGKGKSAPHGAAI